MRRGLVLGAGGVLGASWTIGALSAVQDHLDWDARDAAVLVGTSAGSVLASALSCGLDVETLLGHQRGAVDERIDFDPDRDAGGAMPPLPRPFPASPRGLLHHATHPFQSTPMAFLSAWVPQGRADTEPIGKLVDGALPGGGWAPGPPTWIVATDLATGRRVPFGRSGSPRAELRDAVRASCAIPGWFAPVSIDGRRYVDGGACSAASVDLVTRSNLDEVVVLSPMASLTYDAPLSLAGRLERQVRRLVTRRLVTEVKQVAATGTRVIWLSPGTDDLEAIGANLMDPSRRELVLDTALRTSRAFLHRDAAA